MAPASKSALPTHQRILNATAALRKRGIKHACRKKVAAMCGLTKETKAFTNSLGILKNKKMYLVYDKDTITINEEGLRHGDGGAELGSNRDLLVAAQGNVKGNKSKDLLAYLFDGRTKTRADVAAHIGSDPTSKGFTNLLGPLRKLNYVEYVQEGGKPALRMTDDIFTFEGRPDED